MRRKLFVCGALIAVIGVATSPAASAGSESLVTFSTSSTGTRVLTSAVAPTFPAADLAGSQTISTTGVGGLPATSLVTEVLASGSNPWSVKAQMCGPNSYASPTLADCATQGARMVRAANATGDDVLQGSDIAVAHGTPVKLLGGGTVVAGSETNLGSQITLLNNTGQSPLSVYSGTYASTTNLTISNFTRTGTWKGYWVVTEFF